MKIIILRMLYPNDVTHSIEAHQHYLYEWHNDYIDVYTISSILGKEKRVYDENTKDNYEIIGADEYAEYGFTTPSFVDCTKQYHISIDETVDLTKLNIREVKDDLKARIDKRIMKKKEEKLHTVYNISTSDFKKYNVKVVRR